MHGVLKVRHSIGLYHGRMSPADRKATQNAFMGDELTTVIATNAFGLGIDKRDLRFVLHYHFPGSVEAYYQEAGRDGEPATCTILYRVEDSRVQSYFLGGKYPDIEEAARVALLLEQYRCSSVSSSTHSPSDLVSRVARRASCSCCSSVTDSCGNTGAVGGNDYRAG